MGRRQRRTQGVFVGAEFALAAVLLLTTTFQVRFGLAPLKRISEGLAAIRGGGAERLEGAFPVEIAPLARESNALIEANREPPRRVLPLCKWPPAILIFCPGDMMRARTMTGLATDADLREGRGEPVARRVVILGDPGRVALGAHEIPVLVQPGPVQDIIVLDLLFWVEMKPALAAFVLWTAVPGD